MVLRTESISFLEWKRAHTFLKRFLNLQGGDFSVSTHGSPRRRVDEVGPESSSPQQEADLFSTFNKL